MFAVRRPAPPAWGAADVVALEADGFTLHARRAGDVLVRARHTRWWTVTGGRACVSRGPGAMTRVRIAAPGTVRVQAPLSGRPASLDSAITRCGLHRP